MSSWALLDSPMSGFNQVCAGGIYLPLEIWIALFKLTESYVRT